MDHTTSIQRIKLGLDWKYLHYHHFHRLSETAFMVDWARLILGSHAKSKVQDCHRLAFWWQSFKRRRLKFGSAFSHHILNQEKIQVPSTPPNDIACTAYVLITSLKWKEISINGPTWSRSLQITVYWQRLVVWNSEWRQAWVEKRSFMPYLAYGIQE